MHGLIDSYLPPDLDANRENIVLKVEDNIMVWYDNLPEALNVAKDENKPVFIDFTGYTCTNCRWMESNVFTKTEVKHRFGEMVLVQLYTDGGPNHRENQEYEINRFGTAALPYYVILSPDNQVITTFPGMTRNFNDFLDFLDKGLAG